MSNDDRPPCTSPLYRTMLKKPNGHYYEKHEHPLFCTTSEDDAEREYEVPKLHDRGWPGPVSGVAILGWNFIESRFDLLKEREAKPGEFERQTS